MSGGSDSNFRPSQTSSVFAAHNRALSHYKTQLASATTTIASLEAQLKSLQTVIAEERRATAFWKARVSDLDRRTRIQDLENNAALRAKREADKEAAQLRVELERIRQGATLRPGTGQPRQQQPLAPAPAPPVPPPGVARSAQTDDEGEAEAGRYGDGDSKDKAIRAVVYALWNSQTAPAVAARQCECGAARALRKLYPINSTRGRKNRRPPSQAGSDKENEAPPPQPNPPYRDPFTGKRRERKNELKMKIRATKERIENIRCESRWFEHMLGEVDVEEEFEQGPEEEEGGIVV